MNKYLARLKSEKSPVDVLPKLPKGGCGSYVSAEGRHISEKNILAIKKAPTISIPQWQHDFCLAHAMFNNWSGSCPCSINECLISKIIDSGGNISNLRKLEIGKSITTDMVIDEWLESGEPIGGLLKAPLSFICMAESIQSNHCKEKINGNN